MFNARLKLSFGFDFSISWGGIVERSLYGSARPNEEMQLNEASTAYLGCVPPIAHFGVSIFFTTFVMLRNDADIHGYYTSTDLYWD